MTVKSSIIAIAATAALALCSTAQAQEPASQAAPQSPASQPAPDLQLPAPLPPLTQGEPKLEIFLAAGELMRVDTAAKIVEVRTGRDTLMTFSYTDDTNVIRADKSPLGLATMAGSQVTVRYTKHGDSNVATEIEIHAPQK